jgi:transposase
MNQNTCVTIDVSKEISHIQGYLCLNKPLGKVKTMRHTLQGYQLILSLVEAMKQKTAEIPLIIFEYTGIYHKSLQKFLDNLPLPYHIVSPLLAAKSRQNSIRSPKTDKRDCLSLAKMFYNQNLGRFFVEDKQYAQLRKWNRFYEINLKHIQKIKVNFRETLAIIYPNYKSIFKSPYSADSFAFLKLFPHPSEILALSFERVAQLLSLHLNHLPSWCFGMTQMVFEYAKNTVPGCDIDDPDVLILLAYMNQLERFIQNNDSTLKSITTLAKRMPNYSVILSLPGIQDNLASRFLAELGDIRRFTNHKAMIAYAGIDPFIFQSGDKDGLHLKISKRGNKHLRSILYLMVTSMIKQNRAPSAIRDYYQKKTQQVRSLRPKVASVACANKLLKIVYSLCRHGCIYQYNQ